MTLQRWHKEAIGAVCIALVFGLAGRFSGPTKVVEKEKLVDKIVVDQTAITKAVAEAKTQWAKDVKDHTVVKVIYKEGKPVEKFVYVDRDTTSGGSSEAKEERNQEVDTHATEEKTQEKSKETDYARPNHAISLLGDLRLGYPDKYILSTDYRLFGSLWLTGAVQFELPNVATPSTFGKPTVYAGVKLEF